MFFRMTKEGQMRRLLMASTMTVALSAALVAQTPARQTPAPPAGQAPLPTAARSAPTNPDQKFVFDTYMNGLSEIQLGELAQQKGSSSDVKQFGQRLMTDHSKANDELKPIAAAQNFTLPTTVDAKHKATYDRLEQLSGASFDRAFMQDMLAAHHKAVDNFKNQAKNGKDAEIKAWASKTLPTLEGHLSQAQNVNKLVGSAAPVGTSGAKDAVPAPGGPDKPEAPAR
jgi:putative membrane protein